MSVVRKEMHPFETSRTRLGSPSTRLAVLAVATAFASALSACSPPVPNFEETLVPLALLDEKTRQSKIVKLSTLVKARKIAGRVANVEEYCFRPRHHDYIPLTKSKNKGILDAFIKSRHKNLIFAEVASLLAVFRTEDLSSHSIELQTFPPEAPIDGHWDPRLFRAWAESYEDPKGLQELSTRFELASCVDGENAFIARIDSKRSSSSAYVFGRLKK